MHQEYFDINEIDRQQNPLNGNIRIRFEIVAKPGNKLEVQSADAAVVCDAIDFVVIVRR